MSRSLSSPTQRRGSSPSPSAPTFKDRPTLLPLWKKGSSNMSSIPSTIRLSPLKLILLVLATSFVAQMLPSFPAWLSSPSKPRFYVKPEQYWPLPSNLVLPPPTHSLDRIPNLVHFVYGYKAPSPGEEPGELMPYYAYLAIRSALVNIRPEKVLFHHLHEPRGPFWDLLKPHLTLVKTPAPEEIYGRKLSHFAHKSDVIRLQALQEHGGIYLDIDMFVIRPFKPLMNFQTVMAMEASPNSDRPPLDPEGLCNAVILSRPRNRFIDRWLASYQTFTEDSWAGHSVQKPWELARQYPDEITVLDERAFFWPLWEGSGAESRIRYVHEESVHDFHATKQFAYHTWESLASGYLNALSPDSLRKSESSFGKMAKRFVTVQDDEAFRVWKEMKEREMAAAAAAGGKKTIGG